MKADRKDAQSARPEAPAQRAEPPALCFPACGALVDAFWWARRGCRDAKAQDGADATLDDLSEG